MPGGLRILLDFSRIWLRLPSTYCGTARPCQYYMMIIRVPLDRVPCRSIVTPREPGETTRAAKSADKRRQMGRRVAMSGQRRAVCAFEYGAIEMRIERHYTKARPVALRGDRVPDGDQRDPQSRTARSSSGSTDIEVPEAWSQVAADIIAQKYFRKAGVPGAPEAGRGERRPLLAVALGSRTRRRSPSCPRASAIVGETDSRAGLRPARRHLDLLGLEGRLLRHRGGRAGLLRRASLHAGHADGGAELAAMVQHRPALGLWHRRARPGPFLRRPQDRQADLASTSAYEHPQPHACFIQSVADDLVNEGGIMDLWVREARLFKYGSGTGSNFSALRGEGEKLSGGGTLVRPDVLPQDRRPRGRRHQVGRHDAPRRQDGGGRRRPSGHRDLYRLEGDARSRRSRRSSPARRSAASTSRRVMRACVNCEGPGEDCFDPEQEPRAQARDQGGAPRHRPRQLHQRVIQFAQAGLHGHPVRRSMTPTGIRRPISPSPARTPTIRCASPTPSSTRSRPTATGTSRRA